MKQPYVPAIDTCQHCRFWRDKGQYRPEERGSCHRHAPHGGMYAYESEGVIYTTPFPTTLPNDTCGDFELRNC